MLKNFLYIAAGCQGYCVERYLLDRLCTPPGNIMKNLLLIKLQIIAIPVRNG